MPYTYTMLYGQLYLNKKVSTDDYAYIVYSLYISEWLEMF